MLVQEAQEPSALVLQLNATSAERLAILPVPVPMLHPAPLVDMVRSVEVPRRLGKFVDWLCDVSLTYLPIAIHAVVLVTCLATASKDRNATTAQAS